MVKFKDFTSFIKKENDENVDIIEEEIGGDEILQYKDVNELDKEKYEDMHQISSKVAYLIGVNERFFNEGPFETDIFEQMEKDHTAVIIRDLCTTRTAIASKNRQIRYELQNNLRTLDNIPDLIPTEPFQRLGKEGIYLVTGTNKSNFKYIIDINKEISNRINNCKHIFPTWVVWEYIKNLFIMPNGYSEDGIYTELTNRYYPNKAMYPYMCYINWQPEDLGNILINDRVFLSILYKQNNDKFKDFNMVTKIAENTIDEIFDFIEESTLLDIIVDCENTSPFKLAIALNELNEDDAKYINKLILIDDPNTSEIWKHFETIVDNYEIENISMDRVNKNKSLVDVGLTAKLCQEHYQLGVDSFIMCSSDSDFYGIVKVLSTARFMFLVEHDRVGHEFKQTLVNDGILYVYSDQFYDDDDEEMGLKNKFIFNEMKKSLENTINIDLNDVLEDLVNRVYIFLSEEEKRNLISKFIENYEIKMKKDGKISLERR